MGQAELFGGVNLTPAFTTSSVDRTYTSSSGNFPGI
jgi:hypothetical protein